MPAEPALSAECASRAEELARKLRRDQIELDAEGAELVSALAKSLDRIADVASGPPIISESSQPKA
jgi:hypothetical protein